MPRNFTIKLSKEELKTKIEEAWKNNPKYSVKPNTVVYSDFEHIMYETNMMLNSTIEKDISKVEFDFENILDEGFKTTPNGLSYLLLKAGGDWETPVFFIIYFDGNKLRGYIPTDGNTFNVTSKMAFGNDSDLDNEDVLKRKLVESEDEAEDYIANLSEDLDLMNQDIDNRIMFKP